LVFRLQGNFLQQLLPVNMGIVSKSRKILGVQVVEISALKNLGIDNLIRTTIQVANNKTLHLVFRLQGNFLQQLLPVNMGIVSKSRVNRL